MKKRKKKTPNPLKNEVLFLFWRAGGYYAVFEECGKM